MTELFRNWSGKWLRQVCLGSGYACALALLPASGAARGPTDLPRICLQAAYQASQRHSVPFDVMRAITLVETGRMINGQMQPWPWAIHAREQGHWLPDSGQAALLVRAALAEGHTNIDIGCFQINYRWHHQHFPSVEAMLDPDKNADYAARLLQGHFQRLGSWTRAAGAYHSQTPEFAERYIARFVALRSSVSQPPAPLASGTPPDAASSPTRYALLQGSHDRAVQAATGSLVPAASFISVGPLISLDRAPLLPPERP